MKSAALFVASAGLAEAYTITVAKNFMNKNIDPIVVPGQYNSHMHSFFGSDAVNVNTTTSAELQAGCSSADNPNDYSSYWFPTLYKANTDGSREEVPIFRFSAYYVDIEHAEIAIPQDFVNVVGNAQAQTQADVPDLAGHSWFCEHGGEPEPDKDPAAFPSKGCPVYLQTLLLFHDCVNPDTLASAYSGTHNWDGDFKPANRCPAGMFRMPRLRFSIRFDMRQVLPDGWDGPAPLELACGPSYCFHGDFINGWLPEAAENMLLADAKRDFQGVDGPDGSHGDGPVCGDGKATDADPGNGTSDLEESRRVLEEDGGEPGQVIARPDAEETKPAATGTPELVAEGAHSSGTPAPEPTPVEGDYGSEQPVPFATASPEVVAPPAGEDAATCQSKKRRARRAHPRAVRLANRAI